MARSYHDILGVSADADHAELKKAFRRLAHRYHPDISTEPNAQERFIEIVAAYRALLQGARTNDIEVETDTIYSYREHCGNAQAPNKSANSQSANSQSVKSQTAKTQAEKKTEADSTKSGAPQKGCDCHMEALVSIEELYWGVELKVDPEVACHGRRSQKGWHNKSLFSVKVPRGTRSDTRLRLSGKGGAGKNGGKPGDIYLTVKLKPHERYDVSGDNLYVDMPLSRWEAQEGAVIDVVTPGGRVEVNVPAGMSSGQSIRIPNRGLPRTAAETGDLFAVARVVSANTRASNVYKWPHVPHAAAVRWKAANRPRGGESIDIRV